MGRKLSKDEWVTKANLIHGNKYDYTDTEYLGTMKKVNILCRTCGNIFLQLANDHTSKKAGCPHCAGVARLTRDEFVRRSNDVHGFKYDYSRVVYKNVETRVEIICPEHGSFFAKPHGHLAGFGCDKCSGTYKLTTVQFVARAKEKFKDIFDYSEVEYVNMDTPILLTCKIYGKFLVTPRIHLSCKSGYNAEIRAKYLDNLEKNEPRSGFASNWIASTLDEFLQRSKATHGDSYDYSKVVYKTNKTDVEIICKKHGSFWQSPHNHYRGSGCTKCFCESGESKPERSLRELLNGFKLIQHDKEIIGAEMDIYLPEFKVGIEVNGIYHHSDSLDRGKERHIKKTEKALTNGVKLFHFTDVDILRKPEIVLSMVRNSCRKSNKIYARNTEVREVAYSEYNEFFKINHISGNVSSKIAYGLYKDNELVACMSFGIPRFSKNIEWELLRFCTKLNTSVVGGASKLFDAFIKSHNPSSVLSYADRRFGEGEVYKKLKFSFKRTTDIGYSYHHRSGEVISRYKAQKHKLSILLGDKFNPNLSERDNMLKAGYHKIYDCGHNLYELIRH